MKAHAHTQAKVQQTHRESLSKLEPQTIRFDTTIKETPATPLAIETPQYPTEDTSYESLTPSVGKRVGTEAIEYAPLPTGPRSPNQELTHSTVAPEAMGLWSAGAGPRINQIREDQTPPSKGKIKVSYQDAQGNPLEINATQETNNEEAGEDEGIEVVENRTTNPAPVVAPKTTIKETPKVPRFVKNAATLRAIEKTPATSERVSSVSESSGTVNPEYPAPAMDTVAPHEEVIGADLKRTLSTGGTKQKEKIAPGSFGGFEMEQAIGNPVYSAGGKTYQQIDRYVKHAEGGIKVSRLFWANMDSTMWHALQDAPAALLEYAKHSRPGMTTPYVLAVEKGGNVTAYFIAPDHMLGAEPVTIPAGQIPLGEIKITVLNAKHGKLSINGRDISEYMDLSTLQKQNLATICAPGGRSSFEWYTASSQVSADEKAQLKTELQKLCNDVRRNNPITYYRTRLEIKDTPGIPYSEEYSWIPRYPEALTRSVVEVDRKAEKRILKNKKPRTAKRSVLPKVGKTLRQITHKKEKEAEKMKIYKYKQ